MDEEVRNRLNMVMESFLILICSYRKLILIPLLFAGISFVLSGQVVPDHPDLGLHGQVTWLSDTKIRVEYDWSDDAQLLDWTTTNGSTLVRGNGIVTIRDGEALVRSVIWKQLVKCTRINVQDIKAVNSLEPQLSFIANVAGYTGYNSNPPEMIGLIYRSSGNLWSDNGTNSSLWGPSLVLGKKYTVNFTLSESAITAQSSSDNVVYSHSLSAPPDPDRQVALGGLRGDTEFSKLTIEGEINMTLPPPPDMIDIQSCGDGFSPEIEVAGNPIVEWIFNDGTTSASTAPVKDYGSIGIRHNLLRVTPWSALTGINVGYDSSYGGYGGFAMVKKQNVLGFKNISLARSSLKYLCASYSPLSELDLTGFTELRFIELVFCHNLATLKLGTHPSLERLCIEDCNLSSIDLSGCHELEDYRGASNRYTSVIWGNTGAKLFYLSVESNPQFASNLPDLTQFPLLKELVIWDDNQTGPFICHNRVIGKIDASDNHYTSVDISGCTDLSELYFSGNKLVSLNLGTANNLTKVQLSNCYMAESLTDYVLQTLDMAGLSDGELYLSGNAPPSASGMVCHDNLKSKGWTVSITSPGQAIAVTEIIVTGAEGEAMINSDNGTLRLEAEVIPAYATDKTVTWSITSGIWRASVDSTGLVTALGNGTIIVRATANDNPEIYGELMIVISNQIISKDDSYSSMGKIIVTNNDLVIMLSSDFTSWRAELYSLKGNLVATKFVESEELIFDISKLAPGIYIIVLSRGGNVRVAEIVRP